MPEYFQIWLGLLYHVNGQHLPNAVISCNTFVGRLYTPVCGITPFTKGSHRGDRVGSYQIAARGKSVILVVWDSGLHQWEVVVVV